MIYCVKCTECKYKNEVIVTGYTAYQEYLKTETCPDCKAKIVDDFAAKIGSITLSADMAKNSKRDGKAERATKRRAKAAIPNDPYNGFREKGEGSSRKIDYDYLRGKARSDANKAKKKAKVRAKAKKK